MQMERRPNEMTMEGNCILIGLQMNEIGRKLLDHTLRFVASKGDRIVALHVCKKTQSFMTNISPLFKTLEEFLAKYDEICRKKEVTVVGRVVAGNSVQKVLVKEAKLCAAITVVVGVNRIYSIGGYFSLAKYCSKNLPSTTTIIAVDKGNSVLVREATKPIQGEETKPVLRTVLHPNVGMDPTVIIPNPDRSASSSSRRKNDSLINYTEERPKLGWPLLKSLSNIDSRIDIINARKMSVSQWVMTSLPRRSLQLNEPCSELCNELNRIINEKDSNSTCKWFCYKDLCSLTDQFSSDNLIGKGGSSYVYKCCLENGEMVAIKLCKLSAQASKDFLREVEIMTKLKHERIAPLLGVCVEANSLISIYSYHSKGNLEENLNGENVKTLLNWEKRFNIAQGIASAISYLHNGSDKPIIHRDIKSSNILLTDECEPLLADFGFAIWAPNDSSSITDNCALGTFGYLAPEYLMNGHISSKVDVYAFGVILLELLTGRKSISDNHRSLVTWATPKLNKGDFDELLDPTLDAKYNEIEVRRMIQTASVCIIRFPHLRPGMSQILGLLKGEETKLPNPESINTRDQGETDCLDDELCPTKKNLSSLLELAFLDVDDLTSPTSTELSNPSSFEEYMRGQCSRSSSFD